MHLNPYGEYAVVLAASLANDWPATRTEIETRTRDVGMTMEFDEASDDHALTRTVIDEWLTVVDASDPQERARLLNAQMATASAYPRLTDHDGEGWHLHYRAEEKSLPDVLRSIISVGTALHLTTRGMHRLGRCAAGRSQGIRARPSSSTSPATVVSGTALCVARTAMPSVDTGRRPNTVAERRRGHGRVDSASAASRSTEAASLSDVVARARSSRDSSVNSVQS